MRRMGRIAGMLLLACAVWAGNAAAQASAGSTQKLKNPLNDLLDEAQAALDKNDFQAAIEPLQKFLAEQPNAAFAHCQLAYAYLGLKRSPDAKTEYQKCMELDPKLPEAPLNLGMLLLSSDPAAAVAPLKKAVELLPAQSRPRVLLGVAEEKSGDLAGAAEAFDAAARLDTKDAEVRVELGNVYLKLKKPGAAETAFRQAVELEPKNAQALRGLAESLAAQQKPEAAAAIQAYLATQPDDPAAKLWMVHSLLDQKKYDDALAELKKATEGKPKTVEALELEADILLAQKKFDDAAIVLQQAIALAPRDARLHAGLGRVYMELHSYNESQRELRKALELDGRNAEYWKDLSSAFYLGGNPQGALAALDALEKLQAATPGTWFLRALCYDKLNQVTPALDAYRKFLEVDKNQNPDQVWQATQRIHVLEKEAEKKR